MTAHGTLYKTLSVAALSLILSSTANATLFSRLGGQAIYDDVLNITWLANANLAASNTFGVSGINTNGSMTWDTANEWIGGMNADGGTGYLGTNDWRLPTMIDNGNDGCAGFVFSGGTDCGFNVLKAPGSTAPTGNESEMASLFYDTLNNNATFDTNGDFRGGDAGAGNGGAGGDWGLINTGADGVNFTNLQSGNTWSGLENPMTTSRAWFFDFSGGSQSTFSKDDNYFALAVRDGDIAAVPVPAAVWLMGSALTGLFGFGRRKQK